MRNYSAVIRLARFKVEELQKQMATLDASRADLQRQVDQLAASVPEEQVAANASKEGFVAYGSYAQAVIVRKQNIRGSMNELEAQAGRLRAELEKAFAELKKFEIMEDRRVAALKAERDKRDQAAIDEIAQRRRAAG